MNKESDWVIIGRFGRPQGLKGLVRIISFTEPESTILDYLPWHIQIKDQWMPLKVETSQIQNKMILAKVASYSEREHVAELTNCNIGVLSTQLPNLTNGEYYWHDLVNMSVVNKEGVMLGHVTQILATGANDVLVVSGERRYLIPYIHDIYIVSIDPVQQHITVDWDENF